MPFEDRLVRSQVFVKGLWGKLLFLIVSFFKYREDLDEFEFKSIAREVREFGETFFSLSTNWLYLYHYFNA